MVDIKGIQMDDNDFDYELFREKYGIDLSLEDDIDGEIEAVQPDIPKKHKKRRKARRPRAAGAVIGFNASYRLSSAVS